MDQELVIPTAGVKKDKETAYIDFITRYLSENDNYNQQAVYDGLYRALQAVESKKTVLEILHSIDEKVTVFQLHWIVNALGDYSKMGPQIQEVWDRYQKSLEPKKTRARRQKQLIADPEW